MISINDITVTLSEGDFIELYSHVDMDTEKAITATVLFEGVFVNHPNEDTIQFTNKVVDATEFNELLEQSDGVKVLNSEIVPENITTE
jgi:hypothetical protein